jgi:hypothetical protein
VGVTERHAHGIVNDLTDAGYIIKEKDGRRNSYMIHDHLPVPDPTLQDLAIGNVIDLLIKRESQPSTDDEPELKRPA